MNVGASDFVVSLPIACSLHNGYFSGCSGCRCASPSCGWGCSLWCRPGLTSEATPRGARTSCGLLWDARLLVRICCAVHTERIFFSLSDFVVACFSGDTHFPVLLLGALAKLTVLELFLRIYGCMLSFPHVRRTLWLRHPDRVFLAPGAGNVRVLGAMVPVCDGKQMPRRRGPVWGKTPPQRWFARTRTLGVRTSLGHVESDMLDS